MPATRYAIIPRRNNDSASNVPFGERLRYILNANGRTAETCSKPNSSGNVRFSIPPGVRLTPFFDVTLIISRSCLRERRRIDHDRMDVRDVRRKILHARAENVHRIVSAGRRDH